MLRMDADSSLEFDARYGADLNYLPVVLVVFVNTAVSETGWQGQIRIRMNNVKIPSLRDLLECIDGGEPLFSGERSECMRIGRCCCYQLAYILKSE